MSQENVEIVRRALAAAPADPEALFSVMDEHVVWDYVGAFPEVVTYHGPGAVREFFREWSEAFDDFGFEAEEILDGGHDSVLVLLHQWGRGKETGASVENRTWQVFRLRGGKVVHCHGYDSKAEAVKAARRSEQDAQP
jgi:ketosteroid isomerase-like protein